MTFANLSGGRDSTTMVIKYLELGRKIDYIIFADTLYEFSEMYEYIDKLDLYLKQKFNKSITRLKPKEDILYKWAFSYAITKGEHKGKLRGLPMKVLKDYCTRELKVNPIKAFIKEKLGGSFKPFLTQVLIGYTYNEVENGRVTNLDYATAIYPLHEFRMNEKECEDFLKQRGIANPLYKHFKRTGCFLCPKQSKNSWFMLYKHYPKLFDIAKSFESEAKRLNCINQTFNINKSLEELEQEFKNISSFDDLGLEFNNLDYDVEHVCFCK